MRIFERGTTEYDHTLEGLTRRGEADLARVEPVVRDILDQVRDRGDAAVQEYTERFDGRNVEHMQVPRDSWGAARERLAPQLVDHLEEAAARVRRYHEHQRDPGFRYLEEGVELGQRVRPVKSAGVYAPGGKARYPSTVLMSAIPAQVAGVKRIVLATPRPTDTLLLAAELSGVTEIIDVGGAQAIGALAYGTSSVDRVETIVGPGNLYVACAKRLVFGLVNIDQIAGPSEILVVADDRANPAWVAADLLSQAEHDEDAYPLLITLSRRQAEAVATEVQRQLETLPKAPMAREALSKNGLAFVVGDLAEAARVADEIAIEHLSLNVSDPYDLLSNIHHAGAVFLGAHTPEAAGDYAAGPSHVLPTGGAARFGSPLGVYDFLIRTSIIRYGASALKSQGAMLSGLARAEELEAHARAVDIRLTKDTHL